MNEIKIGVRAAMGIPEGPEGHDWPQAWDWEEFLFGGKLHRCGYAADRVMVLVVATIDGKLTSTSLSH